MRGNIIVTAVLGLIMLGFQNCASPKFVDASGGFAAGKTVGNGTDGNGGIPTNGGADGVGGIPAEDDSDGFAAIPIAEFLDAVANLPVQAQQIIKEDRCYISHGGGHGMELCMTGDKSELLKLWPMEVKGNAICAPVSTVTSMPALFAGAMVGRCP